MFKKLFSKLFFARKEEKTMTTNAVLERPFEARNESVESLRKWLTSIHFNDYLPLFVKSGYNLATVARMTPEDLTAIGVTNPIHRQKLKIEIDKLHFPDSLLEFKPESLLELLEILQLEEYFVALCEQGYDSLDKMAELSWEDLEDIGIAKLGHQKRLILASKRIRDLENCSKSYPSRHLSYKRLLPMRNDVKLSDQQMIGGNLSIERQEQTELLNQNISAPESLKRVNTHGNGSQLTTFTCNSRPNHLFLPFPANHLNMKCKQTDTAAVYGNDSENCSNHINRRNNSIYKSYPTTPTALLVNGFSGLGPKVPLSNENMVKSGSRGSLEDQTSDIGHESLSGSSSGTSSVSSTGSRHSTVSLDSGRVSDMDLKNPLFNRLSVHSYESVGSYTRGISGCRSSSQSSLGSGTSGVITEAGDANALNTPSSINYTNSDGTIVELSVAEMILHGVTDSEVLQSWLTSIHYEEYLPLFLKAGYDMPTISRMTPEDLTAIGITKPSHRRRVKAEIQKLNISDGIPNYKPESLAEWLKILRLQEYLIMLCQQGYDTIDRVVELTWEDLEEIGIKKLGHQKRLMLAIKRIQDLDKGLKRSSSQFANPTTTSSSNDSVASASSFNYEKTVQSPGQVIPIQTSLRSKSVTSPTVETPTTPEFSTFQQLPTSEMNRNAAGMKHFNHGPFAGLLMSGEQSSILQSTRGRSLESIDKDIGCKPMYSHRYHPQYMYNYSHQVQQQQQHCARSTSGYETDSEIMNHHNSDMCYPYEMDGTATLHRPKGLFKMRPVAKIAAKSRQTDVNCELDSTSDYKLKGNPNNCVTVDEKSVDSVNSVENSWLASVGSNSCEGSPARSKIVYKNQSNDNSIYAALKKKSTPPPPPKRTNSMKSSSTGSYILRGHSMNDSQEDPPLPVRCNSLEAMQEQAFATCVKSLASRFQITDKEDNPPLPERNHTVTPRFSWPSKSEEEFPPPPSPLPHLAVDNEYSANDCVEDVNEFDNVFELKAHDKEATMSSSSSSESMPFANDNIGTIKPKVSNGDLLETYSPTEKHIRSPTSVMSAPPSVTTSPFATILRKPKNNYINGNYDKNSSNGLAGFKPLVKNLSVVPRPGSSAETISAQYSPVSESKENAKSHSGLLDASSPSQLASTENVIDDIELMLANLSNQLDAILESELQGD